MKTLKVELIKEGWVEFHRFHCKEGYIDKWMGDVLNHPDHEHEVIWQLNSFTTYFRCNGKEWVHFKDSDAHIYLEMRKEFTAEEIWEHMIKTKYGIYEQYTYDCKVCGELFENEDDLYEHYDDEHN